MMNSLMLEVSESHLPITGWLISLETPRKNPHWGSSRLPAQTLQVHTARLLMQWASRGLGLSARSHTL